MSQSQWNRIADHFRGRIESGDLRPGERIQSDAKLAEEWNVSRPTAHRALHELQRLGLVVRSKGSGTIVAERIANATGRIAFIVDRLVPRYNFPHTDLIRGIQDVLGEDTSVVIAQCEDDWRREARQLERLAGEVDGIILYPTSDPRNNVLIQKLFDSGYPIVVLDRFPEGICLDSVVSDNAGATHRAMDLLVERGHRNIGFFSFAKAGFSSIDERYGAYCHVLQTNRVDNPVSMTRWFSQALEPEPRMLVDAMQDALFALTHRPEPVTALFCVEDFITAGVLEACDRLGMRVPQDLEIAFFNDWPPMMLRNPWALHRIVQSVYAIGRTAATLLHDRLSGDATEPRLIRVPADLFPAESQRELPIPISTPTLLASTNARPIQESVTNGG